MSKPTWTKPSNEGSVHVGFFVVCQPGGSGRLHGSNADLLYQRQPGEPVARDESR